MADRTSTTPADQAHLLDRPLRCVVVTPEATILDRPAEFVALPLYDGEIGIGRGHSPLIGRLGYGEMRLRTDDGHDRAVLRRRRIRASRGQRCLGFDRRGHSGHRN